MYIAKCILVVIANIVYIIVQSATLLLFTMIDIYIDYFTEAHK